MRQFLTLAAVIFAVSLAQPAAACSSNAECDDLDPCNGLETCQGGTCVNGFPLVCDDLDPCTTNTCGSSTGCAFLASPGCMIAGRKLKMGARSSLRLTLQAEPEIGGTAFPANFSSDDPVLHGATLRVFSNVGDQFDATYAMPTSKWQYIGTAGENRGYVYKDKANDFGPIKIGLVRNGKPSKFKGGGSALDFSLENDPNPVNVVLQFGSRQYCLSYGGIARFNPGTGYKAKKSFAPTECPFP